MPEPPVTSTYRLQLHAGFTFDDARAVLPYLHDLGISHVYCSPIATAVTGSTHGYDVTDPSRINPELGGDAAYARLVAEQRRLGMGQLLDIVPNHLGVAAGENAWWLDVLRHGPESEHAALFDIDWSPPDPALQGRVLLPILGDELDAVLARGELSVVDEDGEPWLRYYEHRLPLRPGSAEGVPRGPGADPAAIAALLERQHYRLDYWQTGKARVNYRRFFLIDELVGVRVEDPAVFDRTHALVRRLVAEGAVDGVRIDHVDGLADPAAYLARLRETVRPRYTTVEKILAPGERLPDNWACDGTTGYDFMRDVAGLFVDEAAEPAMTRLYEAFAGDERAYDAIAYASCAEVAEGPLRGQLDAAAGRLWRALGGDATGCTEDAFATAMRALIAGLPVYRTYHAPDAADPAAPAAVAAGLDAVRVAGADAATNDRALEAASAALAAPPPGDARAVVIALQQLMPAVAAKGVEDTAFFRFPRLVSLCEVGGAPDRFGTSVARFHEANQERHLRTPRAMLATGTHDHKRGEDVRARISALTEIVEDWEAAVLEWSAIAAPLRRRLGDAAPSPKREYALYQALAGTLPADGYGGDPLDGPPGGYAARLRAYLRKTAREAEERTSWTAPDAAYEAGLDAFIDGILGDPAFVAAVRPLAARAARLGAIGGLAQALLKIAGPGVADVYQGAEFWGDTLVDPDNRRPVDFAARAASLDQLDAAGPGALAPAALAALADAWPDGRLKQYVMARALRARRDAPALFVEGDYVPLAGAGEHADHLVAFGRTHGEQAAIAVVARLGSRVAAPAPLWHPRWGNTKLRLPSWAAGRAWRDVLTGNARPGDGNWPLQEILGALPVALFVAEASPAP